MKKTDFTLHWLMTKPSAMPAAGACSVLVMVIIKIDTPTAIAANTIGDWFGINMFNNEVSCKNDPRYEQMIPMIIPILYPPINLLGVEAYVLGMAKTINDVAPSDAIRAVSVKAFKNNNAERSMPVARRH